jgi:hypothetical protein
VSDTLSTPDPATQVAEVRHIITNRGTTSCETVLVRIRRVVDPPPPAGPVERDNRGFPKLRPSDPPTWTDSGSGPGYPPGSSWERHDDPHPEL